MNTDTYLWGSLAGLAGADAITTVYALTAANAPEANPLLAELIHATGPLAVLPAKVAYVLAAYACWRAVDAHGETAVLTTGIALSTLIVANNLVWLVGRGLQ